MLHAFETPVETEACAGFHSVVHFKLTSAATSVRASLKTKILRRVVVVGEVESCSAHRNRQYIQLAVPSAQGDAAPGGHASRGH